MKIPTLNIVIVGSALWTRCTPKPTPGLPRAKVAAIVDSPSPKKARTKAARLPLGSVPVFADPDSALAAVSADIVNICLPTDHHAGLTMRVVLAELVSADRGGVVNLGQSHRS